MGINEHGLSVGTTNIKTDDSRIGVGYLSILHRAIRCHNLAEATSVVEQAPVLPPTPIGLPTPVALES